MATKILSHFMLVVKQSMRIYGVHCEVFWRSANNVTRKDLLIFALSDKVKCCCSFCDKMLAHWKDKDIWLHGQYNNSRSEIWHEEGFSELNWFWDPDKKRLLLIKCSTVISYDTLYSSPCLATTSKMIPVTCRSYFSSNDYRPTYARFSFKLYENVRSTKN
uniref:Uncharacterized protein n=1 Tax=Amphimedon queenslandica TaxID=400682 RepID=A0A1X7U689_AMPQE